tara:strand:+ start:13685 stop:14290 length:606 start_codon:yes stop_codon:yes gene_type:complete
MIAPFTKLSSNMKNRIVVSGLIILIVISIVSIYLAVKRGRENVLYRKVKKVSFPINGLIIDFPKHYPNLKFDYVFDMSVVYTGGSNPYAVLLDRGESKIILDMSNGSLYCVYNRFPAYMGVPDNENRMVIKVENIIPFQKNIKLKISQDLRVVRFYINNSLVHLADLDYIPYLPNINGICLPNGASHWVYIKELSYFPHQS